MEKPSENHDKRLLAHEHVSGGARNRAGCERLVAAAPAGQSVLFACPTEHIAVLDEIAVRVWVKADRPGVRLAARIAMPRSTNADGGIATALIRGEASTRPGQWQQLSLIHVPKQLAAEVRVMRAGSSAKIDPREAYVQAIVLIVPGEPKGVEVVTDELEIEGVVVQLSDNVRPASFDAPPIPAAQPAMAAGTPRIDSHTHNGEASAVRLQGSMLLVEGRPFLPRAIEWQGESLEFLAKLGFNTIMLPTLPSSEQIAEATQLELWFLCAAPKPDAVARDGLGQVGDRVLAWLVEDAAIEANPEYGRNWATLIRRRDAVGARPIVMAPDVQWQMCSKVADLLVVRHPRLGVMSRLECDEWLESRASLTRPGTPLWACIPTQFGNDVQQQAAALSVDLAPQQQVDADRVEALLRLAVARGMRGVLFASTSPLDEENPQAHHRATLLQLANRQLELVEPWLAGGKAVSRIDSADAAWTGIVLHVDRARLLIPLQSEPKPQAPHRSGHRPDPAAVPTSDEIAFVVPGVPESIQVYLFSPVALRPLSVRRIAGGTRIVVPAGADGMVLITEDPHVAQSLRQRIARDGPEFMRLSRTLAAQRASLIAETGKRLAQLGYNSPEAGRMLELANIQLRQSDAFVAAGRIEPAYPLTHAVRRALDQAANHQRRAAHVPAGVWLSHPLDLSYDGLVDFAQFWKSFPSLGAGDNLLYGGDFEDLGRMTQFGWRHVNQPAPGIQASARLSTSEPKHGAYCLELFADVDSRQEQRVAIDSAAVWIVSPPVPVEQGQLVEITGWVRVEASLTGSVDGLQIVDTLGGGELSLAVRQTSGWQPFQIIRGVPQSTELRLTFALAGLGTASVDGVMVRTLAQPIARRLPITSPADPFDSTNTASRPRPLFLAPQPR